MDDRAADRHWWGWSDEGWICPRVGCRFHQVEGFLIARLDVFCSMGCRVDLCSISLSCWTVFVFLSMD